MRRKVQISSLFFALCALPLLQASPTREPVVLVLLHSSANAETPSLRTLIIDAITVELEARDAAAVSSDETISGNSQVFSVAEKSKADFVIYGTYQLQGNDVELGVSWYDLGEKKVFPEVRASGLLDLSFDSVVSHLVAGVLDRHEQRLASLPALPPQKAETIVQTSSSAVTAPVAVSPADRQVLSAGIAKASPLSFSVGSAPFIPVFKASAYLPTVGLSFSAEGEYRFPFASGLIGISVVSGVHLFHAEKASIADAFAIPVGAGIVYRTLTGSPVDFSAKAQAGPAIFVLSPAGGGSSVGVVPFLSTGLGATLNFSTLLAASVDLDYVAIFVPDAIMGFVPSVALDMRF